MLRIGGQHTDTPARPASKYRNGFFEGGASAHLMAGWNQSGEARGLNRVPRAEFLDTDASGTMVH